MTISMHDKPQSKTHKLSTAYQAERTRQEIMEVELNRGKIAMIDANGRLIRIKLMAEH